MKKKQNEAADIEVADLQSQAVLSAEEKSKALRRISMCAIVATVAYVLPKIISFNISLMATCADRIFDSRMQDAN